MPYERHITVSWAYLSKIKSFYDSSFSVYTMSSKALSKSKWHKNFHWQFTMRSSRVNYNKSWMAFNIFLQFYTHFPGRHIKSSIKTPFIFFLTAEVNAAFSLILDCYLQILYYPKNTVMTLQPLLLICYIITMQVAYENSELISQMPIVEISILIN